MFKKKAQLNALVCKEFEGSPINTNANIRAQEAIMVNITKFLEVFLPAVITLPYQTLESHPQNLL